MGSAVWSIAGLPPLADGGHHAAEDPAEEEQALVLGERRSRLPFAVVFCTPAFAEAVRHPLRPRLRVRFQKPMASRR
jgi:hypothetical protein